MNFKNKTVECFICKEPFTCFEYSMMEFKIYESGPKANNRFSFNKQYGNVELNPKHKKVPICGSCRDILQDQYKTSICKQKKCNRFFGGQFDHLCLDNCIMNRTKYIKRLKQFKKLL